MLDRRTITGDAGFKVDENGSKGRSDTTRNIIGYKI